MDLQYCVPTSTMTSQLGPAWKKGGSDPRFSCHSRPTVMCLYVGKKGREGPKISNSSFSDFLLQPVRGVTNRGL